MKKALIALMTIGLLAAPVGAETKLVRLAEDASLDAPPGLDLTYLDVGRSGKDLEIRIGIEGMFPPGGGYPELPGIEWIFEVKGRTLVAEAVATADQPLFFLFDITDGGAEQVAMLDGTYDWSAGYTSILVPLKTIGAKTGTRISGLGPKGTEDVDAHVHAGTTVYPDYMATTKDFVVP